MMFLFHELLHIFSSMTIGVIGGMITKEWTLTITTSLIAGVFIDLDHLYDYWRAFGIKFNLKYFLKGYQFLKNEKIYLPLHAWELVFLLFFITYFIDFTNFMNFKTILLTFSFSLFFHLVIDIFTNKLFFSSYLYLNRLFSRFQLEKLVSKEHYRKSLKLKNDRF